MRISTSIGNLNPNDMEVVYVIRNFTTGKYLSIEDKWEDQDMCREFETKAEAFREAAESQISMCVIEEVHKF